MTTPVTKEAAGVYPKARRRFSMTGFDPGRRGYYVMYREHEVNHCPGCGRTHWHIGRILAECAFCATALPLEASLREQPTARFTRGKAATWPSVSLDRPRIVRKRG